MKTNKNQKLKVIIKYEPETNWWRDYVDFIQWLGNQKGETKKEVKVGK